MSEEAENEGRSPQAKAKEAEREARKRRLAEELRENLRRRKRQQKGRAGQGDPRSTEDR